MNLPLSIIGSYDHRRNEFTISFTLPIFYEHRQLIDGREEAVNIVREFLTNHVTVEGRVRYGVNEIDARGMRSISVLVTTENSARYDAMRIGATNLRINTSQFFLPAFENHPYLNLYEIHVEYLMTVHLDDYPLPRTPRPSLRVSVSDLDLLSRLVINSNVDIMIESGFDNMRIVVYIYLFRLKNKQRGYSITYHIVGHLFRNMRYPFIREYSAFILYLANQRSDDRRTILNGLTPVMATRVLSATSMQSIYASFVSFREHRDLFIARIQNPRLLPPPEEEDDLEVE